MLAQNIQLQLHKKSAEWRNVDSVMAWPKVWDAIFRTDMARPGNLTRYLPFLAWSSHPIFGAHVSPLRASQDAHWGSLLTPDGFPP